MKARVYTSQNVGTFSVWLLFFMLVYKELFYWMTINNKIITNEMATITTGRQGFEEIKEQDASPDLLLWKLVMMIEVSCTDNEELPRRPVKKVQLETSNEVDVRPLKERVKGLIPKGKTRQGYMNFN